MDMVNGMLLARRRECSLDAQPGHRNQNDPRRLTARATALQGSIHAVATMWRENGFLGFYQGVVPAVVKGAATNLTAFRSTECSNELFRGAIETRPELCR